MAGSRGPMKNVPRGERESITSAHAEPRHDDADAFIPDPGDGPAHTDVDLAEALAEEMVTAATTGQEHIDEDLLDESVPEDVGGPFVETDAETEFGHDSDASNPPDAAREAEPTALHAPRDDENR